MKRFVLALDLKADPALIAEYDAHHSRVWPEIEQQILATGIRKCEIYRFDNRLCMILETSDEFTLAAKAVQDSAHEATQRWEELMSRYQQPLPGAEPGQKWVLMQQIYCLEDATR